MKTLEEIREYISCPQLGDDHYGKWGALSLEQRQVIYDLINFVECDDLEITRLKQEIARLNKIIDELEKYIIDKYYIDDWEEKVLSQEDLINKLKELKEEGKPQEIPLFEGTMEQLDNLTILKEEGNKDE